MPTTLTKICGLLSVFALLVAAVPVTAMDWVGEQSTEDTCCASGSECAPNADTEETDQPHDQDCCPSGCDDCFLLCCNGLLSLDAFSVTLDVDGTSQTATVAVEEEFFPAHPGAIYHPPRG